MWEAAAAVCLISLGYGTILTVRRRRYNRTGDPLTMVTWQEFSSSDFRTQLISYPLDESDRTVKQILEDLNSQCAPEKREAALAYWRQVFDYVVELSM